jgi:hypothetical protein
VVVQEAWILRFVSLVGNILAHDILALVLTFLGDSGEVGKNMVGISAAAPVQLWSVRG